MKMKNTVFIASFLMLSVITTACSISTSQLEASWSDPKYTKGPMEGLLVIFVSNDYLRKKSFEDEIGEMLRLKGITAVAGYEVIPPEQVNDEEFLRQCIIGLDTDGILISRILEVETKEETVAGYTISETNYSSNFYNYYNNLHQSKIYQVPSTTYTFDRLLFDNRLYRCDQQENMIWQLQLKVTDTKPFSSVIEQVGDVILRDMTKNNLL